MKFKAKARQHKWNYEQSRHTTLFLFKTKLRKIVAQLVE